ncbi:hypothetical protein J7K25_00820 [bacterium]|nr:hypothetical protein [bacterium]
MKKKSKWVRFREAVKSFFVSLFKKIISFLKNDRVIREIFKQAGVEIITLIKNLEFDNSMSGDQKRKYALKQIKLILKNKGIEVRTYIINLVIEMALSYIRKHKI